MSSKKEILFSIKSNLSLEEYKKMFKYIPEFYWSIVRSIAVRELILVLIISLIYKVSILATLIIYIVVFLYVAISYKIRIEWLATKVYKKYMKKNQLSEVSTVEFYDGYLIKRDSNFEIKIRYSDINKLIETETNFYIQSARLNLIVNINKSDCNLELMDFIRKIGTVYKKVDKKKKKVIHNKERIKKGLLILFILTLFSIYGASITLNFITRDKPSTLSNDYIWVFWFWLTIPILSIIYGCKYKMLGFKCTKNIVAGFIIGISLLVFGSFSFIFPSIEIEYNKINNYKKILNVDFPSKGILTQEKYDILFDSDKTNVINTQAFYKNNNADVKNFEKDIVNGKNWIKASKIKEELKILIPYQLRNTTCKNCYYLIYNEDTNEYNKIPDREGDFRIYVSLYNFDTKSLDISNFDYKYEQ